MKQTRHAPIFNMKAIVQETGLKPDTLRAWERRYGLPNPERTAGGHRVYSQRDIDTLRWLIDRQDEGMSISHAIELWFRLESQGQDPLLVESATSESVAPPIALETDFSGESMAELRQAWISACQNFDEGEAEFIINEAFARFPPETVVLELLQKGLAQVGEEWFNGDVTVQQEHFASELAMRRLEALVGAAAKPTRPGRIVVGCPAGEEHTFVSLLITLILRRLGWEVLYLGANVPIGRLESTLSTIDPQLVIFSAQLLTTAASLLDTATVLQEHHIRLAYGGRIFNLLPQLRKRIPGYFLGEQLENVGARVEQLLTRPQLMPAADPSADHMLHALEYFERRRPSVEAAIWNYVRDTGMRYEQVELANRYLASNIKATLRLGDMSYLKVEIDWIKRLLSTNVDDLTLLPHYLRAYKQSLVDHLDARGEPIYKWFNQLKIGETANPNSSV